MKIRLLSSLIFFVSVASGLGAIACGDDDAGPLPPTADAGPTTDGAATDSESTTDGGGDGAASEEIAAGLQVAVPWPALGQIQHLSMALDDQGDPILSYMITQLGNGTGASVWFTRWDRAAKGWAAPVKIDDTGNVEENDPHRETSIAFDASTKTIGIAYQKDTDPTPNLHYTIQLALSSDGGKTFKSEAVSAHGSGGDYAHGASLVLANDSIHIVYTQDNQTLCGPNVTCGFYATRSGKALGFPTRTPFLTPPAGQTIRVMPTDLALDSAGNPGFLYFIRGPQTYETQLMFARPGVPAATVMTSNNIQNDVVNASLAFDGTKPRVVAHLKSVADATYDMQYATSDTGGPATWTANPLPRAGTHTTSVFQSLSITSTEVVIASQYSGSSDTGTCGGPKILRSKAAGAPFDVSCADVATVPSFAGRYATIRHRVKDGKLLMAFVYTEANNTKLSRGLILWREK